MGNIRARMAARTVVKGTDYATRNDRWLTPLPIVRSLGTFDLDPAAAPDHPTAEECWTPEAIGDGLAMPWHGRVWLNPPYGRAQGEWIRRLLDHGSGVGLIPVAMGTRLWQDVVMPVAPAILFYRHRVSFLRRDGETTDDMVSPQASALVAASDDDADALIASGLPGIVLRMT